MFDDIIKAKPQSLPDPECPWMPAGARCPSYNGTGKEICTHLLKNDDCELMVAGQEIDT